MASSVRGSSCEDAPGDVPNQPKMRQTKRRAGALAPAPVLFAGGTSGERATTGAARPNSSVIVGLLAMLGEVDALMLGLDADPQADRLVDHEVEDRAADARPSQGQQDRLDLDDQLGGDAVGFRMEGRREDGVV